MPENNEILLEQFNIKEKGSSGFRQILFILSILVTIGVFWSLKLTGIGIAGEAFCGMEEHLHTEECTDCIKEEHIHIETCYSDITADLENSEIWEMTLADMVRGPTVRENVILVAQSQLGYRESIINFQVSADGIRRGITRYGQWYGNPYGDWSAMFASFCLYYAGADDLPTNAGPESMRLEWESEGLYKSVGEAFPESGNLIFLSKNANSPQSADSVAIITDFDGINITVIEGDLENEVAETQYLLSDSSILGYGIVPSSDTQATVFATGTIVAQSVNYDQSLFTDENSFVVYTVSGSNYYAFDGNGNAVPITIDSSGNIYTEIQNPDSLLWTFTYSSSNTYLIQNIETGKYMHAYPNNGSGVTTSGAYTSTLIQSGSGVKIRSNNEYARLDVGSGVFRMTQSQSEAAVYYFGMTSRCTVWLDGTDGGLGHLTGSPDIAYSVTVGNVMKLPTEWTSPSKYSYKLRGW
ncbi:MAG: RICIN domain-containing protein, partial [Clostridia bacterium]|nr:RICIN domain-containing protein [Clostridia bacterium]